MFRICHLKYNKVHNGVVPNIFAMKSTAAAQQTASNDFGGGDTERIVIPKKINRGPTDLLYTLSKTIGRDPTAVHYKYLDDPYLTPTSLFTREQYALSREAGKQTAKWIKKQHAQFFNVSVIH